MYRTSFFLFCLVLFGQLMAQPNEQEPASRKGAKLINLPKKNPLNEVGLKEGDIVLAFAGVPTSDERILLKIDQFVIQLEQEWKKEGKQKDFWKKKAAWVQKKTRGYPIQPSSFTKENQPLYLVIFKQILPESKKVTIQKTQLKAGVFLSVSQRKKEIYEQLINCYKRGVQAQQQYKLEQAISLFQKSFELSLQINHFAGASTNLDLMARVFWRQGKLNFALDKLQHSLKIKEKIGSKSSVAETLNNIGLIYCQQDNLEQALEHFERSLKIKEQLGNLVALAISLNNIGVVYQNKGKLEQALEYFERALKIKRQLGDSLSIAQTLSNMGGIFQEQGKLVSALEYFEQALELTESMNNLSDISQSLNRIGVLYQKQANFRKALNYFERAFAIAKETENPVLQASYLTNIGRVYQLQGKTRLALDCYYRSLKLEEKLQNPTKLAKSLNSIGVIYQEQGKSETALDYFRQSLKIAEKLKNSVFIFSYLNNIGVAYENLGQLETALEHYLTALKHGEQLQDSKKIALSFNNIGVVYQAQGKLDLALDYFERSLILRESLNIPSDIAQSLSNIGGIYGKQKKAKLARDHYERALKYFLQAKNPVPLSLAYLNLSRIYWDLGEKKRAVTASLKAIEFLEYVLNYAGAGRKELLEKKLKQYYWVVGLLLFQQENEKAFQVLQQCKAYGFLTDLSEFQLNLEQHVSAELLEEREHLIQETASLYEQIIESSSNKKNSATIIATLQKQLIKKEEILKKNTEKIRLGNPVFGQIRYPKPTPLKVIQENLKSNEIFLEYFSLYKGKEAFSEITYCFVIGKEFFEVIPITETKNLEYYVQEFRHLIWETQESEEIEDFYEGASTLYQLLIQPVLKKIDGKTINHLIIAPDGFLNLLAFEALCAPQEEIDSFKSLRYLLDQYQISYTSSATVYHHSQGAYQKQKKQPVAQLKFFGIGDPDFKIAGENSTRAGLKSLPGSRKELENISILFESDKQKILLGKDAIEPAIFLENLLDYQIFHFATHGLIDPKNPMYSSLAFTALPETAQKNLEPSLKEKGFVPKNCSDGFLQVRDILKLHQKINAELIILSACETGSGKIERADGIVGLTRAFQFAGTPSIIVSLWSVSDDSTQQLMQHLYQELLAEKQNSLQGKKLFALHQAKLKLRHSKKYCSPYHWAPFILRGLP